MPLRRQPGQQPLRPSQPQGPQQEAAQQQDTLYPPPVNLPPIPRLTDQHLRLTSGVPAASNNMPRPSTASQRRQAYVYERPSSGASAVGDTQNDRPAAPVAPALAPPLPLRPVTRSGRSLHGVFGTQAASEEPAPQIDRPPTPTPTLRPPPLRAHRGRDHSVGSSHNTHGNRQTHNVGGRNAASQNTRSQNTNSQTARTQDNVQTTRTHRTRSQSERERRHVRRGGEISLQQPVAPAELAPPPPTATAGPGPATAANAAAHDASQSLLQTIANAFRVPLARDGPAVPAAQDLITTPLTAPLAPARGRARPPLPRAPSPFYVAPPLLAPPTLTNAQVVTQIVNDAPVLTTTAGPPQPAAPEGQASPTPAPRPRRGPRPRVTAPDVVTPFPFVLYDRPEDTVPFGGGGIFSNVADFSYTRRTPRDGVRMVTPIIPFLERLGQVFAASDGSGSDPGMAMDAVPRNRVRNRDRNRARARLNSTVDNSAVPPGQAAGDPRPSGIIDVPTPRGGLFAVPAWLMQRRPAYHLMTPNDFIDVVFVETGMRYEYAKAMLRDFIMGTGSPFVSLLTRILQDATLLGFIQEVIEPVEVLETTTALYIESHRNAFDRYKRNAYGAVRFVIVKYWNLFVPKQHCMVFLGMSASRPSIPARYWSSPWFFLVADALVDHNLWPDLTVEKLLDNTAAVRREMLRDGAFVGWMPLRSGSYLPDVRRKMFTAQMRRNGCLVSPLITALWRTIPHEASFWNPRWNILCTTSAIGQVVGTTWPEPSDAELRRAVRDADNDEVAAYKDNRAPTPMLSMRAESPLAGTGHAGQTFHLTPPREVTAALCPEDRTSVRRMSYGGLERWVAAVASSLADTSPTSRQLLVSTASTREPDADPVGAVVVWERRLVPNLGLDVTSVYEYRPLAA